MEHSVTSMKFRYRHGVYFLCISGAVGSFTQHNRTVIDMNFNGFLLEDTGLVVGEEFYDLHAYYEFRGLSYDISTRVVTLEWIVRKKDYVPVGSPTAIAVILSDVSSFAASPRDPESSYDDDDCLNTSMFVTDDAIQAFGIRGITLHEPHLMLEFIDGFTLLIRAAEAHCRIEA